MPRIGVGAGGDQFRHKVPGGPVLRLCWGVWGWGLNWGLASHKESLGKDLGNCSGRPSLSAMRLFAIGQGHRVYSLSLPGSFQPPSSCPHPDLDYNPTGVKIITPSFRLLLEEAQG